MMSIMGGEVAGKTALIVCYSPVGNDARVSKQIRWLESAGYRVDVLSRGPEHPDASGRGFGIGFPPLLFRFLAYLFLSPAARFRAVVARYLPVAELADRRYDLIVVNDHQLLPWIVEAAPRLTDGPVALDLHEIYSGKTVSLLDRVLHQRYDEWLLEWITSEVFTTRLTVADGIADIYRDEYEVPRPTVIRNVARYEELEPSRVDPDAVTLVHHGYAAIWRGIDLMLDAALLLEPRFRLVLMVMGDERSMAPLRRHPAVVSGRVEFRDPVAVTDVAEALNEFDLELIFFPPRYRNIKHALPNKFFEAVQARLGVVIGHSVEMMPYVREHGFGVVVDGWSAEALAATINSLSTAEIVAMKQAADQAAEDLSTKSEGPRFLAAIGA